MSRKVGFLVRRRNTATQGLLPVVRLIMVLILCCSFATPLSAQSGIPDVIVEAESPDRVSGSAGSVVQFDVALSIVEGWHINTNPAAMESLIPTRLMIADTEPSLSIVRTEFPSGQEYRFEFANQPITVYEGQTTVGVSLKIDDSATEGSRQVPLEILYQACDDTRCLRPTTLRKTLTVEVTGPSASRTSSWPTVWSSAQSQSTPQTLAGTFRRQGLIVGLVVVFLLGLSLNLTPCVYPMIPITVGYFGGRDGGTLTRRIIDALFFVLGMALVYAILGALAGFGGSMLGDALQNPWIQVGLAGLMVVLSGAMFGLYELKLPAPIKEQSESMGKALGTFGMGMTLGVVAAPCLAPSTVALLGFVGQLGHSWAGAGLFFVLALGLGLPYVFLAVFSSQLHRLPGSGSWMEWVKKLLGFMILGVAIYFLWPMLTNAQFAYLMMALVIVAVGVLMVVHPPQSMKFMVLRGMLLGVTCAVLIATLGWTFVWVPDALEWESADAVIEADTTTFDRPTVVYVGASWCVPCKEMEITTFRDARVRATLENDVRAIKVDVSNTPPSQISSWLEGREVLGVPTMMFFSPSGGERRSLRLTGYVDADQLLEHLRRISTADTPKTQS